MVTVTIGHKLGLAIGFLDQNGNPMLTPVNPDTTPVWTNSDPSVESLTPAADGLSAEADALAAGSDVISLDLQVGGQDFPATLAVTVEAEPQILTSVVINATAI